MIIFTILYLIGVNIYKNIQAAIYLKWLKYLNEYHLYTV